MHSLFKDYVTPKVVLNLFGLFLGLIILGISVFVGFIIADSYDITPFEIILLIIAGIVAGGLLILLLVVWAEKILVLFDIADNTKKQADVYEKIYALMVKDREE